MVAAFRQSAGRPRLTASINGTPFGGLVLNWPSEHHQSHHARCRIMPGNVAGDSALQAQSKRAFSAICRLHWSFSPGFAHSASDLSLCLSALYRVLGLRLAADFAQHCGLESGVLADVQRI